MEIETVKELFRYNYWAHRGVWECILKLSEEQFVQEFDYAWKSVHGQVVHVMGAEEVWLTRIRDGISPPELPSLKMFPTRNSIRRRWDVIEQEMSSYLSTIDSDVLKADFTYTNTKGNAYQLNRGATLLHLVNHGTDHRAQILYMIHQMGGETIEQDYLHLLRS